MQQARRDPDELLANVIAEERRAQRGKLTVFFGAAPGVGKTFAMLEAARSDLEQKRDVVVGIVETHGRYETAALLLGLDLLPRRRVEYRGVTVEELDLDAALARKPELLLVDELAHTNAEGSRHPKRWQDVEELLDAGIDVYTTMNVQHVESLNDVVARITGVSQRETVPDSVLEWAHEIKLIDLPPDDLLERLREGKVYVPAQAERAIENFFKKGNLIALRELSLRHTAQRVDAEMRAYRLEHGIEQTWAASDRILVGVSPSPSSARLLRAARRMAGALHADWVAVYVETPSSAGMRDEDRARLSSNLRLAQQLGAETVTLAGSSSVEEILRFARERNVTKIIVGKPTLFRVRDLFKKSFVDQMVRESGDIDIYVTAGEPERAEAVPAGRPRHFHVGGYLAGTVVVVLASSFAGFVFGRRERADVVMVYLLGIVLVSLRYGYGPSLLAVVLSIVCFDFFFIQPYYTLAVADLSHVLTFAVMFFVALLISGLTQRVRLQADAARAGELRTAALYAMSRQLAASQGIRSIAEAGARHVEQGFACAAAVFGPNDAGELVCLYQSPALGEIDERERAVQRWVLANGREAGLSTTTLSGAKALHLPLAASGATVGVLSLFPKESARFSDVEQRRLADAFAAQIALALERAGLAAQMEKARIETEAERLRSTLLSSVSHDLRTPLAVITGAASTLVQSGDSLAPEIRRDLAENVLEEAERLNHLIRNLLDMTRLESGKLNLNRDWQPLEEVLGAALNAADSRLANLEVKLRVPAELPLVLVDGPLLEQLFINLLENASKYGAGTPIEITASAHADEVHVEVADRGPGIQPGEEERLFEKFHRSVRDGMQGGVGLGLAICRAIAVAHGGRIWAENRAGGGAVFHVSLPVVPGPPAPPAEEETR